MDAIDRLRECKHRHPVIQKLLQEKDETQARDRQRISTMLSEFLGAGLGDKHFLPQFCLHPTARYWELLLGCLILRSGRHVEHVSRGPDFRLTTGDGVHLWIEATSIDGGDVESHDAVPQLPKGGLYPCDAVEMRITGAISSKLKQWEKSWTDVVNPDAPFVLAINTVDVGIHVSGMDASKAVLGLGGIIWRSLLQDEEVIAVVERHDKQARLFRSNGSPIEKTGFTDGSLSMISALAFGHFNLFWPEHEASNEITVVHNPTAKNQITADALPFGRHFSIEVQDQCVRFIEA